MLCPPLVALTTAAILLSASPTAGQELGDARSPRGYAGISLQVGQAKGRFADYVDVGGGGGGYVLFLPAREFPLGLRLSAMYLLYGSETRSYPLVPGIVVDVTTKNQIFQMAVGPQLTVGRGRVRA